MAERGGPSRRAERGEEFEVVPTGFGRDGTATARHGGVVSITGAIPGEAVRVRALAHRRGVTHARIVEVLDPSPDRVVPPCAEIANGCGACPWQHLDLAARLRGHYDLIVFPESALMSDPETDPVLRAEIVAIARRHDAYVLVNVIERGPHGLVRNTDRLYAPSGRYVARYSKRHLVPFGEYVPWPFGGLVRSFIPIGGLTPGTEFQPIPVVVNGRRISIGPTVCYEGIFPEISRELVDNGADLLVNLTDPDGDAAGGGPATFSLTFAISTVTTSAASA